MTDQLTPAEIQKALLGELIRMKKVVEEAEVLKPRIKKAQRFIRELSETWNLPIPEGVFPVATHPKPEGIEVSEDGKFQCQDCDRVFSTEPGLRHHQTVKHG